MQSTGPQDSAVLSQASKNVSKKKKRHHLDTFKTAKTKCPLWAQKPKFYSVTESLKNLVVKMNQVCYRFCKLLPGGKLFYLSLYTITFTVECTKSNISIKHGVLSESEFWALWAQGLMWRAACIFLWKMNNLSTLWSFAVLSLSESFAMFPESTVTW